MKCLSLLVCMAGLLALAAGQDDATAADETSVDSDTTKQSNRKGPKLPNIPIKHKILGVLSKTKNAGQDEETGADTPMDSSNMKTPSIGVLSQGPINTLKMLRPAVMKTSNSDDDGDSEVPKPPTLFGMNSKNLFNAMPTTVASNLRTKIKDAVLGMPKTLQALFHDKMKGGNKKGSARTTTEAGDASDGASE